MTAAGHGFNLLMGLVPRQDVAAPHSDWSQRQLSNTIMPAASLGADTAGMFSQLLLDLFARAEDHIALTAATTFVKESLASPKRSVVFGSKRSSLSIPAKPGRMERFMKTMLWASSTARIGMP